MIKGDVEVWLDWTDRKVERIIKELSVLTEIESLVIIEVEIRIRINEYRYNMRLK